MTSSVGGTSNSTLDWSQVLSNSSKTTSSSDDAVGSAVSSATGNQTLGKDAFLQLLVTQLKNQNPLDPQDNTEFVAQLAQFSSLEGITTLNDTVNSIAGTFSSSQALQASSLVGRSVIVQADKAVLDPAKGISGVVTLPASTDTATVKITDSSGATVRTLDLGKLDSGNNSYTWDGKDDDGNALAAGTYNFNATYKDADGNAVALTQYLPATVNSVTMGTNGGEMMLNIAGVGAIALSKVQTIGL